MHALTRVVIVDDHAVFATTLAYTLGDEADLDVLGTASDLEGALDVTRHGFDVAVCDFRLERGDGLEVARALLERHPSAAVVMLTASTDDAVLVAAIEAGCAGFVTKSQPLDVLVDSIRAAAEGASVITPEILARVLPRIASGAGRASDLTAREREVLALMAGGGTNQAIADELVVSRDTVRNHVANILRKLGAHSKLEAVTIGVRKGLVSLPE